MSRGYSDHGNRHGRGGTDPIPLLGEGATFHYKLFHDTEVVSTGDGKLIWPCPPDINGLKLVRIILYVSTPSSSGLPTLQLKNLTTGNDMLSTKVSIDVGDYDSMPGSGNPSTPVVINPSFEEVSTGDRLSFDVDIAGTGAKGMGVMLFFDSDVGGYGAIGADGTPGSVWHFGSGAPGGGTGVDGDYYLRTSNGDVYQKDSGSWSVIDNIMGPTGQGVPTGGSTGEVLAKASGTDYDTEWVAAGSGGAVASDAIWDAKGDLAVGSAADTADNLAVGTNGFVLTADSAQTLGVKWAAIPTATFGLRRVDIKPYLGITSVQGTWAAALDFTAVDNMFLANASGTAQNDEITYQVALESGTWTIQILVLTASNCGIVTASIDGSSVGTMDTYSAVGTHGVTKTISGITVATTGMKTLSLKMATKNGSSSSYRLNLHQVTLIRTGA